MLKQVYRRAIMWSVSIIASVFLVACNSASTDKALNEVAVELDTIFTYAHCQSPDEKVDLLTSLDELSAWWSKVSRASMPPPAMPGVLSAVNFSANNVLIVNLGDKPNPGFSLMLKNTKGHISEKQLQVSIQEILPEEGAIQLQVRVNPCIVVVAAKADYMSAGIVISSTGAE